jgi:cobaltochelatase CobT
MVLTPPIVIGLWRRISTGRWRETSSHYRAFTTAFDEVMDATRLPAFLPGLSPKDAASFDDAAHQFDRLVMAERDAIAARGAALAGDLRRALSAEERGSSVASFLIDHSGSMRGSRMMSALLAVDAAVGALADAGIANEILGFTTTGWKGGKSRRAWTWAGEPRNPGRLCDLRHLIYGDARRASRGVPAHLRLALRPDVLYENIDGEALAWAAGRLDPARWKRRYIFMISDGSPADDSTLLANGDLGLLMRHLEETEDQLADKGFVIATLLVGPEHCREHVLCEKAEEPRAAGMALVDLLRRALLPSADAA